MKSFRAGSVAAYADDITILSSGITIDEAVTNSEALLAYVIKWAAQNMPKYAIIVIPLYIKKKKLQLYAVS